MAFGQTVSDAVRAFQLFVSVPAIKDLCWPL